MQAVIRSPVPAPSSALCTTRGVMLTQPSDQGILVSIRVGLGVLNIRPGLTPSMARSGVPRDVGAYHCGILPQAGLPL